MPFGEEWGMVNVTEDLLSESRALGQLGDDFAREARTWTHPAARALLTGQSLTLSEWAQEAAYTATTGDYWDRREALTLALQRRHAAAVQLGTWWERGQIWNEHRIPRQMRWAAR